LSLGEIRSCQARHNASDAPEYNLDKLRDDYEHMQNMLFGEKPSFEEIMEGIAKLEKAINALV